jgi:hypothetical protein
MYACADDHSAPNCLCFGLIGYSKNPETVFRHVAGGIKGCHEDLVVRFVVSAKVRMGHVD